MPKEVNPVLKLFKWEDYHDGYMITFQPQSTFERFEDIVSRVRNVWKDDYEIDMPPGERLDLVQPEDVPIWRGQPIELVKMEISDGVGNQYSDVLQGALGDCWFMSAVSGLAISGRLSEVVSRYDDKKGVYEFKLQRWDSKTREFSPLFVCVDHRIPLVQGHKAPAFCYSATPGELWPSLLEKAFAKAIRVWKAHPSAERGGKGFSCMDGGLSALGVAHLLGGESGCYWVKEGTRWDKEQAVNLAQLFADLFENGVFINANFKEVSTKVVGPKGETRGNKGLVAGHSYSVLRLEFFNVRGHIFRLVQLRNPWGKSQGNSDLEWNGDWSDHSQLWRQWPEAAHVCLTERMQDGVFWISIEDLADNMDAFEICDAPLHPGAVTSVRSKLYKGVSSPRSRTSRGGSRFRPSNELGARMADDYMRRSTERGEYERRRLEEQLNMERDQRLRLEAEMEDMAHRPKIPARRAARRSTSAPPPVDIVEGESAVVVGSPNNRRPAASKSISQRQRQRTAEALDAADGVIDGQYFGKPILTTSGSAVDLLQAAESKLRSPKRHPGARSPSPPRSPPRSPLRGAAPGSSYNHPPNSNYNHSPNNSHSHPPGSSHNHPPREYETWTDNLPASVSSPMPPRSYSGSVFRGDPLPRYSTRSWVSNEVVAEPITYHHMVVDQGRRTVMGTPSVISYGAPSVVREVPSAYVSPAQYAASGPLSVVREAPSVPVYTREVPRDVMTRHPGISREVPPMVRAVPTRALSTEAF